MDYVKLAALLVAFGVIIAGIVWTVLDVRRFKLKQKWYRDQARTWRLLRHEWRRLGAESRIVHEERMKASADLLRVIKLSGDFHTLALRLEVESTLARQNEKLMRSAVELAKELNVDPKLIDTARFMSIGKKDSDNKA
jgi:hypothetical protein